MAGSVTAILRGFDYQARWFWIEALRLFRAEPVLQRVVIEGREPRGFDDIVSHPVQPRDSDVLGRPVGIDGYQAKFHVDLSRVVRAADLTDPSFLLSKKTSLLQRLDLAVKASSARRENGRFTMITPWAVDPNDLLGKLLGPDGSLRPRVLFDGSTDRSEKGKLRKAWRDHLGLADDRALEELLTHLRIQHSDLMVTDRVLEGELDRAGLALVQPNVVGHPYVDLILAHVKRAEYEFDRLRLRDTLMQAGLWRSEAEAADRREALAIRSWRLGAVHLEDETTNLLDLIPFFHDRELAAGVDWNGDIAGRVAGFLEARVRSDTPYRLFLDAHSSIAFTAGWMLHRADVTPMQTTRGRTTAWDVGGPAPDGPLWRHRREVTGSGGPDIAVALSVTHDVADDVRGYVHRHLPGVSLLLFLDVPALGPTSVRDGPHADALALQAVQAAQAVRVRDGRPSRVHLFAAAPNGLLFHLGRHGHALGPTTVYEFDFESPHRSYTPGISLLLNEVTA